MLRFKSQLEILCVHGSKHKICDNVYNLYEVKFSDLKMKALIREEFKLQEGDTVYSTRTYLTDFDPPNSRDELVLLLDHIEHVVQGFREMESPLVRCNGKLILTDRSHISLINNGTDELLISTLSCKNSSGNLFYVLLTAFNDLAMELFQLRRSTIEFLNIEGILKRRPFTKGFEIQVKQYDKA